MTKPKRRREPGLFMNILGSLGVFVGIYIFGGINIEMRIVLTCLAFLAVSFIAWILWFFKLITARICKVLQVAVFPVMLVVWIGNAAFEAVREPSVIPTPEYYEISPFWLYPTERRSVDLLEKSTFSLSGKLPGIDGATSLRDLYYAFAETVIADSYYPPHLIHSSRTPDAYKKLISGYSDKYTPPVDMIFVFRPSRRQIEAARAVGKELRIIPIGYDAFVFFVNARNSVDNLTIGQLRDIYSGRMNNWRAAGGDDSRILPYQRYEGSGSQGSMERFMEDDALMEPEREHRFRFMRGIVAHTSRYRNLESAIGYSFLYYVETMLKGGGVKLLKVDGVYPSKDTIQDGSYPLREEICVVTVGADNPNIQAFIDWMLSPQGQALVKALGYVPVNPASADQPFPATRIDRDIMFRN